MFGPMENCNALHFQTRIPQSSSEVKLLLHLLAAMAHTRPLGFHPIEALQKMCDIREPLYVIWGLACKPFQFYAML